VTRRSLIAVFPLLGLAAAPDTPRNRLCAAANEFHEPYREWAERMNETKGSGTIDACAARIMSYLPKRWRKVERLWKEWLKL
jgi:hypothetical protein